MEYSNCCTKQKSFVGNLISRLRSMAKKPTIDSDIESVFNAYLKKLGETQIYLNNGIFTINFAEAALLLECGAFIYGKKVDLLWDEVIKYQKRILTYYGEQLENDHQHVKLEERLQKYRRKRRKVDVGLVKELPCDIQVQQINDEITKNVAEENQILTLADDRQFIKTVNNLQNDFTHKFCSLPLESYSRQFFIPTRCDIHLDDEFLCCNTQICSDRMIFGMSEFNRQINYREGCEVSFIGYDAEDNFLQKYAFKNNINILEWNESLQDGFNDYIKSYIDTHLNGMLNLQDRCKKLCPRRSSICLTRLSEDVLQKYLERDENHTNNLQNKPEASTSAKQNEKGTLDNTETLLCNDESIFLNNETKSFKNSSTLRDSCSTDDSGFNETLVDSLNELSQKTTDDETNNNCSILEKGDSNCDDEDTSFCSSNFMITSTPKDSTRIPKRTLSKCENNLKRKLRLSDKESPKRRKKSDVFRWLKTVTTTYRKYEKFYNENYKREDGENGYMEDLSDSENEVDTDRSLQEDDDLFGEINNQHQQCDNQFKNVNIDVQETEQDPSLLLKNKLDSQLKYLDWKRYIEGKIAQSSNNYFDIHEYGSKILHILPKNKPMKFGELVKNMQASEVARYFVSSLDLVKDKNVAFLQIDHGKITNDTFEIKLLNMERHHDKLVEYQAPSEEMMKTKLAKVQNIFLKS